MTAPYRVVVYSMYVAVYSNIASFPGLSGEGGKAWGLLRVHARKLLFIFCIIHHKISNNDVIVHRESARKECADTFVHTVAATI